MVSQDIEQWIAVLARFNLYGSNPVWCTTVAEAVADALADHEELGIVKARIYTVAGPLTACRSLPRERREAA